MVSELKSCPFCGGAAAIHWRAGNAFASCEDLGCVGSDFSVDPGAWNTRAGTGRLSELEAEVARLHIQVASLELLRPLWAQGYSRDSLAAQTLTSALSNLWFLLGAKNQTEAESKLKEIIARANLRGSNA